MPTLANSIITAVNNLGTTPIVVMQPSPTRTSINFHAPGSVDIIVAPLTVLQGGVSVNLVPSLAALGGCYRVYANGGDRPISGPAAGQGWQAFAVSGSNQPLTITEGYS